MLEILAHDTSLWLGIAFVLFIVIAYKMGGKAVIAGLDNQISDIKNEVETAERLKEEAQELLAQYERKHQDAEKEAEKIIQKAKAQANTLKSDCDKELQALMERKEEQLQARLKRMEQNAIAEIQSHAADLVIATASQQLQKDINAKTAKSLTEKTIGSIPDYLN